MEALLLWHRIGQGLAANFKLHAALRWDVRGAY